MVLKRFISFVYVYEYFAYTCTCMCIWVPHSWNSCEGWKRVRVPGTEVAVNIWILETEASSCIKAKGALNFWTIFLAPCLQILQLVWLFFLWVQFAGKKLDRFLVYVVICEFLFACKSTKICFAKKKYIRFKEVRSGNS